MSQTATVAERTPPSTILRGSQIRFTLRSGQHVTLTNVGPPEYAGMELFREHGLCTAAIWNVEVDLGTDDDDDLECRLEGLSRIPTSRTSFLVDCVDIHPHEPGRRPCCNYDPQNEPGPDAMRWTPDKESHQ
jgi:hypothetical protein